MEYVSVSDGRGRIPEKGLSNNGVLVAGRLFPEVRNFEVDCVAHLTYPCARKYDLKLTYEGHLDGRSTERLLYLCAKYFPGRQGG